MGKSTRYLGEGQDFSFDHSFVHSPSSGAQRFADGGAVARQAGQKSAPAPRPAPVPMRAMPSPAQSPAPRIPVEAQPRHLAHGGEVKGYAEGGHFIQDMHMKKGALHRQLGVPEGEKIPAKKLAAAAASRDGPLAEKRAHTAQMLKGLPHHAKGGEVKSDEAQDRAMVKSGIRQHENHEHGGEHTNLKLARGGKVKHQPKRHPPRRSPLQRPTMNDMAASAPVAPPPAPMMAPAPGRRRMAAAAPVQAEQAPQPMPGEVPQLARGGRMRTPGCR